ncbi:MAG: A/G-specific adenine glycosylase [Hyphomicrobiales bacterium]|nr:A/G-specific adenine glycosylase [Hyphomicrobiales bacterium]
MKRGTGQHPAQRLLVWYDRHHRALPWRAPPGRLQKPYRVWLSEIMLQQTTVPAVKAYYEKFLVLWPDFQSLAAAPVDDVMKAWAGLGYYSRARNLHACAKVVATELAGRLPDDEKALQKLPGIGAYTSAAIAAIAFGKRAVVVDANVERVVARLFRIAAPLPQAKPSIREKTDALTPGERAGDFAQAMMDLGATICTPKKPSCLLCPLQDDCAAFASGDAELYPVKAPKRDKPQRHGAVFLLRRDDGKVLMRTRPPKGMLGGMAEFPGTEWSADFKVALATDHAPVAADWNKLRGHVDHVFTHFALRLTVFAASAPRGLRPPKDMRWVAENDVEGEALPTLMRKVWEHDAGRRRRASEKVS